MTSHETGHSGDRFDTTRWSVVLAAGQQRTAASASALESLCQAYWYPLYAYVRRRTADVSAAQDLTQAFFAELLEKNYVGSADPERGRFRAFLLTALKHFLSKQRDKAHALKRGGGKVPLSLDFERANVRLNLEPCHELTPEQVYDRQWAVTLLNQIMQRLEAEYQDRGKSECFHLLKDYLAGAEPSPYAEVAGRLGMTEAAARMAAHRMRQRYRELLRAEIAQTVAAPEEVDEEIRSLYRILNL